MKLRYTGVIPVTFMSYGIGEVEPGQEFSVTDEDAEVFLTRSDVEQVTDGALEVASRRQPATTVAPPPATTDDEKPAVESDDH